MKTRCNNPNADNYQYYGGRGISYAPRWESFDAFLSDMGHPPEGMTLDRIDTDADYSPDNCRWLPHLDQCRNQRRNRMITHDGRTQTIQAWAEETGLDRHTIHDRLKRGLSINEALAPGIQTGNPMQNIKEVNGSFRVRIMRQGKRIQRTFPTVEGALQYRDSYLSR